MKTAMVYGGFDFKYSIEPYEGDLNVLENGDFPVIIVVGGGETHHQMVAEQLRDILNAHNNSIATSTT